VNNVQRAKAVEKRSEVGDQRSEVRDQEGAWVIDHAAEHFAGFLTKRNQFAVLLLCDVGTVCPNKSEWVPVRSNIHSPVIPQTVPAR
jgi:hypothetical protein